MLLTKSWTMKPSLSFVTRRDCQLPLCVLFDWDALWTVRPAVSRMLGTMLGKLWAQMATSMERPLWQL